LLLLYQALEAAHAEHESAERDVQNELLSAQQTVAELRQTGAATQLQLEQLQAQLDESRAAVASMSGRASEEATAHTQQLEAVQRRLELAQQRVAMLEKADSDRDRMPTARTVASSEQMETLKQMNAQLRSELDEANSQLIKQRRQQTSADAARADAAAEHERQMEEVLLFWTLVY
jgi:DNA repair exonuclease SbcCD ATPase subunit